ncbi:MAG: signal recognition particle-docking protein FtsY [Planctomycetota bacterium]
MVFGKIFETFKSGLRKTAQTLGGGLRKLLGRKVDKDFLAELESYLIGADVGVDATEKILDRVQKAFADKEATGDLIEFVKQELKAMLKEGSGEIVLSNAPPTVIMVAGVNGSGKTTSIAKLATWYRKQDKKVLLGAGDTFRAAAIEQLDRWAHRIGAEIVKGTPGSDPSAVAHDACTAAVARNVDVAIIDTAGRLHTQQHLMRELEKIHRVIGKACPGAPHEVLLVLDATNGQNAIQQALNFTKVVKCTGIVLAKLDGTAKGGAVVAIRSRLDLPVKFVGIGEKEDDLQPFDPDAFVEALFAAD